jgi:hypothetical protein
MLMEKLTDSSTRRLGFCRLLRWLPSRTVQGSERSGSGEPADRPSDLRLALVPPPARNSGRSSMTASAIKGKGLLGSLFSIARSLCDGLRFCASDCVQEQLGYGWCRTLPSSTDRVVTLRP